MPAAIKRLIDLMSHSGGQFTDTAEPGQTREQFLMQPQLGLHAASLRNQLSRDQSSHGQDEHQGLKGDQLLAFIREEPRSQDHAKLSDQNTGADAFGPIAHRHPYDGQEENIEQLELSFLGNAEYQH